MKIQRKDIEELRKKYPDKKIEMKDFKLFVNDEYVCSTVEELNNIFYETKKKKNKKGKK